MNTLEKAFSKEVLRRDTLESLKILHNLDHHQFQSLMRFFMTMINQSPEAREERLDSLLYIKLLPDTEFAKLIDNMEHIQESDEIWEF